MSNTNIEYRDPKLLKESAYSRKLFPKLEGKAYELLRDDIKEMWVELMKEFL